MFMLHSSIAKLIIVQLQHWRIFISTEAQKAFRRNSETAFLLPGRICFKAAASPPRCRRIFPPPPSSETPHTQLSRANYFRFENNVLP